MRRTILKIGTRRVGRHLFWQVTIPKPDGGRTRKTFKFKKDAETCFRLAKFQVENYGTASMAMSDRLRAQAIEASELLAPYGASLVDAARSYVTQAEAIRKSRKVNDAIEEYIAGQQSDGRSSRYISDLEHRLGRFKITFGERTLAEVTTEALDNWLRSLPRIARRSKGRVDHDGVVGAVTRNSYRRRLASFFTYALDRGWCATNPVSRVAIARETPSKVGILTPEQLTKLLESAGKKTLPYWAIGAFAGLRSAELGRLEWSDVHFESGLIEVGADKSKTAAKRFVRIMPQLAAWLAPYRRKIGHLLPKRGLRKLLEADREAAEIKPWPVNALRHSFASHHYAHFHDAAALASELGHANTHMVFSHYRERVRPEIAAKYFAILPKSEGQELVKAHAA
jgi:integrase